MRLGKEQAAGYVEDTEINDTPVVEKVEIDAAERMRPTQVPEPVRAAG
jgi:hypothetical protein